MRPVAAYQVLSAYTKRLMHAGGDTPEARHAIRRMAIVFSQLDTRQTLIADAATLVVTLDSPPETLALDILAAITMVQMGVTS